MKILSVAAIAFALTLNAGAAFAAAPAPAESPAATHDDAMKGDAMHGDAMKPMTMDSYLKDAMAMAKSDLALQKQAMAMKGVDPKIAALAKKRAAEDEARVNELKEIIQARLQSGGDH